MGLRSFFPPASAALALALGLATGAGACHDVGLYPLQARPGDAGSEPVDVGSEPVDLGSPTDVGTSDAPVDMPGMPPCANVAVVGYATFSSTTDAGVFHAGTSGGGKQTATNTVTVTTLTDLAGAAADNSPKVIIVSGMLEFPPIPDGGTFNTPISVGSNKTIVGADANAELIGGGLDLTGSSNVIVRNLKISKAYHSDAIHLQYSLDVWIDHCDLSCDTDPMLKSACDDLVGISHASDYVTVSWTYYHDHHDTGIIGHSDSALAQAEDPGHLRVTLYQDRFFNVDAGPRIRFGKVHLFNVDFDTVSDYAVAATTNATVFVESSYFNGVMVKPLTTMLTGSPDPGYIGEGVGAAANLYVASGPNVFTTQAMPWNSDYPPLGGETAQFVPNVVQGCVGTGKIDPLPIP